MMVVGYARTSTAEQEAGLTAQERDLRAAGCEKVFAERVSSVAPRARLEAALDFVREGDVLVVTKPDRLARSTADLLAIVGKTVWKFIGAVMGEPGGRPTGSRHLVQIEIAITVRSENNGLSIGAPNRHKIVCFVQGKRNRCATTSRNSVQVAFIRKNNGVAIGRNGRITHPGRRFLCLCNTSR